jgi:sulfur carrier protein ThiS
MIVKVHFFGPEKQFTQQIPPDVQRTLPLVSVPEGSTIEDLLRLLGVRVDRVRPFVSLNGRYQRDNKVLHDGDQIELVPPMAGGAS